MKDAVTFVMPAFNADMFIGEAVRSIQNQTLPNWKLIIADDGSTDDTLAEALKLAQKDERIKVLKSGKGSGSAYQPRKKAIMEADTEWVTPLDADDLIAPDYLEKLLELQRQTNADIVYPTMYTLAEPLNGSKIITPLDSAIINTSEEGKQCVRHTLDGWRINCNGGIIRKSLYVKTFGRFDSNVTYACADELLTRQLLLEAGSVAFSDTAYHYRENPESITRRKSGKLFEFLINTIALIPFIKKEYGVDSEEYVLAQRQNFHAYFDALRLFNRFTFTPSDAAYGRRLLSLSRDVMEGKVLKNNVSRRYMGLLKVGEKLARVALSIVDRNENSRPV